MSIDRRRAARLLALVVSLVAPAVLAFGAGAVDERLVACFACHGQNGQSPIAQVPSLGAQPVFYVSVQLYMFREGMRDIEPMTAMMKGISDEDLQRMATVLSNLPPPSPVTERGDPARLERARALVQQHRCDFCHNENFSGAQGAPRLAAQREDYLAKAMREYKSNARRAYDPSMADVMHPITDADILDLAHYLARFR